ncbi:unnamed protein product [Rotaria sp. Silwood2]|nr:unnamed protein product [Rotaria sp. Silwood2]CAF3312791.1 unnamed protein product [Rotaria sp. Silwood2]CAF4240894.1 unnamed protein product [Rotaria sp. Silwood2]CAF4281780.1 unnamed protein product [Rotaria sp. Silwood2]
MLPDEIMLNICRYLCGGDVRYAFFNLNTRLNKTITDYYHLLYLMPHVYRKFDYVICHILPEISMSARSLMLNGNWETIMSSRALSVLFAISISFTFPQLQKLTFKWFTNERLWLLVDTLQNLSQLIELNIRFLKDEAQDTLLTKVFTANNGQLTSISFDQDSIYLSIPEENKMVSYSNIKELKINLTRRQMLFRFFTGVPNVHCLRVHLAEISESPITKQELTDLPLLAHLIDFKLHSINLFWIFDELVDILHRIPILQKLTLDLRTYDKR